MYTSYMFDPNLRYSKLLKFNGLCWFLDENMLNGAFFISSFYTRQACLTHFLTPSLIELRTLLQAKIPGRALKPTTQFISGFFLVCTYNAPSQPSNQFNYDIEKKMPEIFLFVTRNFANIYPQYLFVFNPFLPITVEHLSYLSQVIEIWILKYPVHCTLYRPFLTARRYFLVQYRPNQTTKTLRGGGGRNNKRRRNLLSLQRPNQTSGAWYITQ